MGEALTKTIGTAHAAILAALFAVPLSAQTLGDPPLRHPAESLLTAPIPEGRSPYLPDGRTLRGETGTPIPCQCSDRGALVPLGTEVCMATASGTMIVRCELAQNVTTWAPTGTSCVISDAVSRPRDLALAR
jgi:hypothetical protein